jgi:hypothetical protein
MLGQQVLGGGAIKNPIVFVGEVGEACAFAHVQANAGFFDIALLRSGDVIPFQC